MERAISAIDDLRNLGERLIVFEDDSANPHPLTVVKFPKNRGTIIFNDKLYDWYGREVELGEKIKRIVAPFGHYTDGLDLCHCHDNFIVELENGEFAITGIRYYRTSRSESPDYSGLKYAITGGALKMSPHMDTDDSLPHYKAITLDALKDTCFESFRAYNGNYSYAIGHDPILYGSAEEGVNHLLCGEMAGGNGRMWFSVTETRDEIMETAMGTAGRRLEPKLFLSMDQFFGDFAISEGGSKITVSIPEKHFCQKSIRIATDIGVFEHMRNSHFWWYLA